MAKQTSPDLSSWLTSIAAAHRLGVKYRTLLDMVRKGKLHPRKVLRPGMPGGAVSMFDPEEIAGFIEQRAMARSEIVLAGDPGPVIHTPMHTVVQESVSRLPIDRKLYLNLEEAAEYTGLAKGYIQRFIPGKKIGPHGSVVWRRADLECL